MPPVIVYGMKHTMGPVQTYIDSARPVLKFSNGYIRLVRYDDDIGRYIYDYSDVCIVEIDFDDNKQVMEDFEEQLTLAMEEWENAIDGMGHALVSDG